MRFHFVINFVLNFFYENSHVIKNDCSEKTLHGRMKNKEASQEKKVPSPRTHENGAEQQIIADAAFRRTQNN